MALLPGHIQYSPVFVWLFSFLVFLLTSGKCRMMVRPMMVKAVKTKMAMNDGDCDDGGGDDVDGEGDDDGDSGEGDDGNGSGD